jgi:hypothetical protein
MAWAVWIKPYALLDHLKLEEIARFEGMQGFTQVLGR